MGSKKINLMLVTHDLAIGGLQQVVVNICRTIDRDRFNVSVLCLRTLGEYLPEVEALGIPVFSLPKKESGTDYFSFLKVAKILRDNEIDVIHTHNTQPFFDGTIGSLMSVRAKIVHTDHARDFPDKLRYMIAEHLMSYFAYKVIGVSEHTSANLNKYEKIPLRKIETIENGIDGSKYEISVNRAEKLSELGINGECGPILGVCVRLSEQKGLEYLLKAMPKIQSVFPDVKLVIAGDGDLREHLEEVSQKNGVTESVLFLGGRLDIPELLKTFDLYVLPSLWEGLPMIILEAMAAGCPIVATDVGGVARAIKHDDTGLLVEPKDPDSLATAVTTLLQDNALRDRLTSNAKELFENSFSAEIMTKQYETLFLESLGVETA